MERQKSHSMTTVDAVKNCWETKSVHAKEMIVIMQW